MAIQQIIPGESLGSARTKINANFDELEVLAASKQDALSNAATLALLGSQAGAPRWNDGPWPILGKAKYQAIAGAAISAGEAIGHRADGKVEKISGIVPSYADVSALGFTNIGTAQANTVNGDAGMLFYHPPTGRLIHLYYPNTNAWLYDVLEFSGGVWNVLTSKQTLSTTNQTMFVSNVTTRCSFAWLSAHSKWVLIGHNNQNTNPLPETANYMYYNSTTHAITFASRVTIVGNLNNSPAERTMISATSDPDVFLCTFSSLNLSGFNGYYAYLVRCGAGAPTYGPLLLLHTNGLTSTTQIASSGCPIIYCNATDTAALLVRSNVVGVANFVSSILLSCNLSTLTVTLTRGLKYEYTANICSGGITAGYNPTTRYGFLVTLITVANVQFTTAFPFFFEGTTLSVGAPKYVRYGVQFNGYVGVRGVGPSTRFNNELVFLGSTVYGDEFLHVAGPADNTIIRASIKIIVRGLTLAFGPIVTMANPGQAWSNHDTYIVPPTKDKIWMTVTASNQNRILPPMNMPPSPISNLNWLIGIADNNAAVGETVTFTSRGGVATVPGASFTPGSVYYINQDGTIDNLNRMGSRQLGVALTATTILLNYV